MELHQEFPELTHYTGIAGLQGILNTQSLRATHAAFLNDTTELLEFKRRLPAIFGPAIENGVLALIQGHPEKQELVNKEGGIKAFCERTVTDITDSIYTTIIGTNDDDPFVEPYIFSFCTTAIPRVAEHGLLSQWRGYGKEGGYAIVFDTEALSQLLAEEGKKNEFSLFAGNVIYSSSSDEEFQKEFKNDIDKLQSSMAGFFLHRNEESLEHAYDPLIRCCCRYKHWGFEEEQEVRLVVVPNSKPMIEFGRKEGINVKATEISYFQRRGMLVPCVYLLKNVTSVSNRPLPIKRIIVGPHQDKSKRKRAIENLLNSLGLHIPVMLSEIPFAEFY